ncbi:N-acetylmuramoyl-L-alanine amidase [Desulfopila sp. IMCC35008]|uniref:N-acetylmuramoyl-L-alanine amidase n=1 Tax=Desulfopila sp. IMCC35008 TaxID=2653858 RepID=UPI001F110926|nr:N-acetylmuramoyl-L-alanine amidase [Desulfopila sp. IMCC35008]
MWSTLTLTALFFLIYPSQPIYAAKQDFGNNSTVEQLYNQAKFYYNQLETNRKLSKDRENWIKGGKNFRRIYLDNPTSDYAPSCLYMLGRLHHSMYERFRKRADLVESMNYYQDVTRLFQDHRLADDSYYAIGLIQFNDIKDPEQAAKYFTHVIQDYPNGDMHPLAADFMKQLSRDHDIPLPDVMVGSSKVSELNYVLPVKYWSSKDYTRVVIMASGPVNYKERLLEKTKNQPRRLYIDFKDSYIEPQYRAPVPIKDGLLQQIRTGQFSKDTVRVVLDIESIDSFKIYSLPDPFRVVIDVRGQQEHKHAVVSVPKSVPPKPGEQNVDSETQDTPIVVLKDRKKIAVGNGLIAATKNKKVIGKVPSIPSNQPAETALSLAQQLGLGVKRIVLDPGHGGKDPGAIANGLKEKDIVLALGKKLQPILAEELGCEVLLTRTDDTFISLEERTAIANTEGADLFISLHINAHPSPKVRGIETYFLNLSTNAEAMRVAAMENSTSTHQLSDLQDILSDIMKNSKINESSRLARQVHTSMVSGLTGNEFGKVKNLGVKQAPFYVLIGAQMPAILIEIAFISNSDDANNLRSENFLTALAEQISTGIKSYVNTNTAAFFQPQ